MDLRQIRQFIALAETGNFNQAASRIGLTQSALTQAIRKLETELDLQLFVRGTTGTVLTDDGRRFLDHARVIAAQIEAARMEMRSRAARSTKVIRFGVVESLPDAVIHRAFQQFLARHHRYTLKVVKGWSGDLMQKLLNGEIDFAVASDHFATTETPEIEQYPLFTDRVAVVAAHPHPLARRSELSLSDLSGAEWISVTISEGWADNLVRAFAAADLPGPGRILQTNSITYASHVIGSGEAVGLVTPRLFRQICPPDSELRFFDVPELSHDRTFSLSARSRSVRREADSYLFDLIRQTLGDSIGEHTRRVAALV